VTGPQLTFRADRPAQLLAVLAPALAGALVVFAARRGGLSGAESEPVAPWVVAVCTVMGASWLSLRSLRQVAALGPDGVAGRNVAGSFRASWSQVEEIRVLHRGPLVLVELRLSGLQRWTRLGAATRFAGHDAEEMEQALSAHPEVAARLVTAWP
jgi:hypothetical protein